VLIIQRLTLLIALLLFFTAQGAAEPREQHTPIETLTVSYDRAMKSLNDTRTSHDIIVYPEQLSSAQHTVGDIITQSTGVTLNGQGGLFQSYNIRGFSRARIKTEVDGIPIITDRRAGNAISFIPTELISNVTRQKGPQSTL
jgi:iron complex outermembrane receptor protein